MQNITPIRIIAQRGLHGANKKLDSLIRVNHAGELGADRIYAGQMAILGMLKQFIIYYIINFILNALIIILHLYF